MLTFILQNPDPKNPTVIHEKNIGNLLLSFVLYIAGLYRDQRMKDII